MRTHVPPLCSHWRKKTQKSQKRAHRNLWAKWHRRNKSNGTRASGIVSATADFSPFLLPSLSLFLSLSAVMSMSNNWFNSVGNAARKKRYPQNSGIGHKQTLFFAVAPERAKEARSLNSSKLP